MPWEPMDIDRAKAEGACVLVATVIEPGSDPDTLDLQFEAPLGRIDNVPVHYHCQNAETTAGGSLAFGNDAGVYVLVLTGKTDLAPAASDLVVVGFADGLPSYCPLQHIYAVCGTKGFLWDIRRQNFADVPGLTAGIVNTTDPILTSWLAAHPSLTTEIIWSATALTAPADNAAYLWPGCDDEWEFCDHPCNPGSSGIYYCTDTWTRNCQEPTSSYVGGQHLVGANGSQQVDQCGDIWPGFEVIGSEQTYRPALHSSLANRAARSVNLDHGPHQGFYVTSAEYDYYGICTDGYCVDEEAWSREETLSVVWSTHIGQVASHTFENEGDEQHLNTLVARHDVRTAIVTRDDIPAGPVAAVQFFGLRVPSVWEHGAVAAAALVDPETYNPASQAANNALGNAVDSLLAQNLSATNTLTFTIRR